MSWQCERCSRTDDAVRIEAACHHCGALLCDGCSTTIVDVGLLGVRFGNALAVHCTACLRRFHRVALRTRVR